MSESEVVAAERHEQNGAPTPRRSTAAIKAEEYDEGGGLSSPQSWRLHRDIPEPADPWQHGQIQCQRCAEFHEPHCTHGHELCATCAPSGCQSCECEMADAAAIADEIRNEWYA